MFACLYTLISVSVFTDDFSADMNGCERLAVLYNYSSCWGFSGKKIFIFELHIKFTLMVIINHCDIFFERHRMSICLWKHV